MNERVFPPTQRMPAQVLLDARINHKAERPHPTNSIPLFAQDRRYQEAALSAIETSQQGVTVYQPYMYSVEGKASDIGEGKPHHDIASRYASVDVGDKEVWFEIIGQQDRSQITDVDFITADPLQIILGDVHHEDVQKVHNYTDQPMPDKALIRLVGTNEIPLYTGNARVTDPSEIQQAALSLTQHLMPDAPIPIAPILDDIEEFTQRQQHFEHLAIASNGVEIGKPQQMEVMLDNSHLRLLYLYPTISPTGERSTLITNKELGNPEPSTQQENSIIGRTDFYCGCEKHGERAQGHGCGRELLGALRAAISPEDSTPENDQTIIVAWGGVDDLGNGSVLHSLKTPNAQKIGLIPSSHETTDMNEQPTYLRRSREILRDLPHVEHRDFRGMAQVLFAGAELAGATSLDFYTTNGAKKQAVEYARNDMVFYGGPDIKIYINEQAHLAVPPEVRARDQADRHPTRRGVSL